MSASTLMLARWSQAAVLAALAGLALALATLQTDGWWPGAPSLSRGLCALLAVLAFVVLITRQWRRDVRSSSVSDRDAAAWRVLWASQTGFAQDLAARTAASLREAGLHVDCQPIEQRAASDWCNGARLLLVVSTTGEGDPPDHALAAAAQLLDPALDFSTLEFAILALGDRCYQHYCGFGHWLDRQLRARGATPLFDLIEVDNGDAGALRHWQHHLGLLADAPELPDWTTAPYQRWQLARRWLANPGSVGAPVWHLELQALRDAEPLNWQAGDIVEIGPRQSAATVMQALQHLQLAADVPISDDDAETQQTLADRLALSHLDAATLARYHGDLPAWLASLQALPHREYSLASLPGEGAIRLLLREMRRPDGSLGLGSAWLCREAEIGARIDLRIRSNSQFHPPADDRPLILIGNGTGIAGLRALLQARLAAGHARNWLLYGERHAACDDFYAADIAAWQQAGALQRVDAVFSRDDGEHRYVQDALAAQVERLHEWIAAGASIYVCGSLKGMAPGVDAVLRRALGDERVEQLLTQGRYRRDVY